MSHKIVLCAMLVVPLFLLSLATGSVDIPFCDVACILLCKSGAECEPSWRYIILYSRLPQALTALLAGGALSASGLLLQTTFRNPLAAPDIFGVTSGASLAVALLVLIPGLTIGYMPSVLAAFVGAMMVTAIIWMLGTRVRSSIVLVIAGIMVGYLCSSGITLLNAMATEEGIRQFVVWGMGNFSSVGVDDMPAFAILTLSATTLTLLFTKPLNAMLLGQQYAESMGINVRLTRNILLVLTGLLSAIVTAFCGPIAFIALAVPHIARMSLKTSDHRWLLPMTIIMGSNVSLLCNVVCSLPANGTLLPINAVTPLIGAPVIVYVICRRG